MPEKHITGRLQVGTKCNQDCLFCSISNKEEDWISFDQIKRRLKKLEKLRVNDLFITGGEPTKHPEFIDILNFAEEIGFKEITIQSNCSNLSDKILKKIKKFGNVKFNASFHSYKENICNKLSTKNNYKKIIQGLNKINKFNISIFLTIVINKLNYIHLKDHIIFIRKKFPNITHFSFNFIDPVGIALKNQWIVPTLSETQKYIDETVRYILNNNLTFRLERVPLCYMNGFEEFSTEARMLILNEKRLTYFKDPRLNLFIESKKKYHKADSCKFCLLNKICPGLNNNYLNIYGSKELYPLFIEPKEIIARIKDDKLLLNSIKNKDIESRINKDLNLFKRAIKLKPNKNNIYDTYSYFLMKNIGLYNKKLIYKAWKLFLEKVRNGQEPNLLNLYIHFPYCQSNCDYCIYPSTTIKENNQIKDYLNYLFSEIKLFAPLFKGIKFKTLSIGGGTPSLMNQKQLKKLISNLYKYFEFDKFGEKSIEFNPESCSLEKLNILDEFGFNKLAMGIQSLSKNVLMQNKRSYQTIEKIKKSVKDFKCTKIGHLNVDLMLGLKGDNPKDFLYSLNEVLKMKPNILSIYPIKADKDYIKSRYGNLERFKDFYYPLFDKVTKQIPKIARLNNYGCYNDYSKLSYVHPIELYLKKKDKRDVKYPYSNFQIKPYSTLGLGFYAESCINNLCRYICVDKNNSSTLFLKKFSTNEKDFLYSVNKFEQNYSKVKFITHFAYDHFSISREKYQKMFKTDIIVDFQYAIIALKYLNIINISKERIDFKISDEKELYTYLLFFVPKRNILMRIKENIKI